MSCTVSICSYLDMLYSKTTLTAAVTGFYGGGHGLQVLQFASDENKSAPESCMKN